MMSLEKILGLITYNFKKLTKGCYEIYKEDVYLGRIIKMPNKDCIVVVSSNTGLKKEILSVINNYKTYKDMIFIYP